MPLDEREVEGGTTQSLQRVQNDAACNNQNSRRAAASPNVRKAHGGMRAGVSQFVDLWRYHKRNTVEFARHDYLDVFCGLVADMSNYGIGAPRGLSVLDLGCGQRLASSLLLSAHGAVVTAVDQEYVLRSLGPREVVALARRSSPRRTVKTLVRKIVFDKTYYDELTRLSGERLDTHRVPVFQTDACAMPFADGSFDLVVSNAVFEHIRDVPAAVSEVARVLRPGGFCHVNIHNFYSLSGGHDLRWAFPDSSPPNDAVPWGHLMGRDWRPATFLNRLRPSEFDAEFSAHFELLLASPADASHRHAPAQKEGEVFLSGAALELLSTYSREELLYRSHLIIGRKPG